MGAKESRPGSSVENPPSATRAPVVAQTAVEERPYRTTEKDLEKLHPELKQLSLKESRNDAIVVTENSEEGGLRADSGSGNVEKDVEVVVLDDGSKDGEERGKELVSKEEGRGDVTRSCDVDKDEGSKDEEEREVVMVENANEGKYVKGGEEEKGWWRVDMKEKLEMPYPQRPSVKDCTFYLRTGTCSYERHCRFNPPPDRRNNKIVLENATNGKGGKSRNQQKNGHARVRKKCTYYMQIGSCKFSTNCRYHHPDPTEVGGRDSFSDTLPSYVSRVPTTESLQSHLQGNDYEHPLNSLVPLENGDRYSSRPCLSEYQQSLQMIELPQESGQSTSSYYMKNVNCINKPCKADYTKNRVIDFGHIITQEIQPRILQHAF